MSNLTVVILTYNESSKIENCILSAAFADEVIVVDSGSTDGTVEIAKKLGAKVFSNKIFSVLFVLLY